MGQIVVLSSLCRIRPPWWRPRRIPAGPMQRLAGRRNARPSPRLRLRSARRVRELVHAW